jgi:hypothetical protein
MKEWTTVCILASNPNLLSNDEFGEFFIV